MVSTLNGCFIVLSCLSAAVLHYSVHQYFSRWSVEYPGGALRVATNQDASLPQSVAWY
jgi:hypothetical protein